MTFVTIVVMVILAGHCFGQEKKYVWHRMAAPDKATELKTRPAEIARVGWRQIDEASEPPEHEASQAESQTSDDPRPVPQGDPAGCSDGYVYGRVKDEAVQRSKWKDLIQNTSYVHVLVTNPFDEELFYQDGRGTVAKRICPGGSEVFSYRRTGWSKKDPQYVVLRANSADRRLRYYSLAIPLWLPNTTVFYWDTDVADTNPSVAEFQPDANHDRYNEIRDQRIDCRIYGACGYGYDYGGYGVGFGAAFSYPNPFRSRFSDPQDYEAQERFLPRIGPSYPNSHVGHYYRGGGVVPGNNPRFFGGPRTNGGVPLFR